MLGQPILSGVAPVHFLQCQVEELYNHQIESLCALLLLWLNMLPFQEVLLSKEALRHTAP